VNTLAPPLSALVYGNWRRAGCRICPSSIAVAIESLETPTPAPVKVGPATVEELNQRLTAIRERLFWLQAVWATTLSRDVHQEADRYRELFRTLGEQLSAVDPDAFDCLVVGHEALLLAEPASSRPTLPLATQRWFELAGEIQGTRAVSETPRPNGYVADGLQ
jgi:hypothetical protein